MINGKAQGQTSIIWRPLTLWTLLVLLKRNDVCEMPSTPYKVLGGRNHCGQHCWDTDSNVGTFSRKGFCGFYFTVRLILLVLYKTSVGSKSQCFVIITWCCLGFWTFMSLWEILFAEVLVQSQRTAKHCMIRSQAWTWKSPPFSLFSPFLVLK